MVPVLLNYNFEILSSTATISLDVQIVNQFESMVKEEVKIDPRVHSMIIGKRGRTIHKIMDDFKV